MENTDILKLIHAMDSLTNEMLMLWMRSFEHNIGVTPILVLGELQRKGPLMQGELAKLLGYTPGAMTNIANRLVKLELAERLYNENDRRNVLMQITDAGSLVLRQAQEKANELRTALFSTIDEEEVRQFLGIYEKLLVNYKGLEADRELATSSPKR